MRTVTRFLLSISLLLLAACGGSDNSQPTMQPANTSTFDSLTDESLNTLFTSNRIITTIDTVDTTVSVTGGEFSINDGPFTIVDGTVSNAQSVVVRQMSSSIVSETTDTVLTVGEKSYTFSVTTNSIATYRITANSDLGMSISPENINLQVGETASFTITPDAGNTINNVGGCNGSLSGNTYTTGPMTTNCTVVAAVVTAASFHSCNENDNYRLDSTGLHWTYGFYYNNLLPEDMATFECANISNYARDSKNLYIGTQKYPLSDFSDLKFINANYASTGSTIVGAPGIHAASFKLIDPSKSKLHYKDRSNIFLSRSPLENVDYASFQVLGKNIARDNTGFIISSYQRYLYTDTIFDGLDITNFVGLGGNFFLSPQNEVYYFVTNGSIKMRQMANIDANSFQYLSGNYAKDNTNYYYLSTTITQGDRILTMLGRFFSSDGQNIFRGYQRLTEADFLTFQVNEKYGFAYDNNALYSNFNNFSGSLSKVADTSNLSVQDGGYIFTDNLVTDTGLRITESPNDVLYLGNGYLRGLNNIYFGGLNIRGADPSTFSYLGIYRLYPNQDNPTSLARDVNAVYSQSLTQTWITDPSTFELVNIDFSKEATKVYHGIYAINNADPVSFTVLGRNHSIDANNAYFDRYVLSNVVPTDLVVINDDYAHDSISYFYKRSKFGTYSPTALNIIEAGFATVADAIYFQGRFLSQTGASSFSVIIPYSVVNGVPVLAQDATNLYTGGNVIPGYNIDLTTFQTWNNQLFGDAVNVFSYSSRIASAVDFEMMNPYHYREGNQISFLHPNGVPEPMPTADPTSFQVLSSFTSLDSDEVFYGGISLPGLDPATSIHPSHTTQIITDTDTMYYDGVLIANINVSLLAYMQYQNSSIISSTYYKDNSVVYYRTTQIIGADAASFVVTNSTTASDINATYVNGVAQ